MKATTTQTHINHVDSVESWTKTNSMRRAFFVMKIESGFDSEFLFSAPRTLFEKMAANIYT